MKPPRVAVFADSRAWPSIVLTDAFARAIGSRADVELAAVWDTARPRGAGRTSAARIRAAAAARRAFGEAAGAPLTPTLARVCRRAGVPLRVPPGRDVNAPEVAAALRADGVELALSLLCPQIFGPELLGVFQRAVNYHNGLLPAYGGMRATAWSVYRDESESGFTFHLMTPDVDGGPVLLVERVPVAAGATAREVDRVKTARAVEAVPRVLDALLGDDPGRPQTGPAEVFRLADAFGIQAIADPGELTWDELERRLRAFEVLSLRLDGGRYDVTRLVRVDGRPKRRRLAFRTADGVLVEPTRFVHLPLALYRGYRALRRR